MHRRLKQEAAQPPAANRREQQRTLERFRQEYHEIRPHEALNMQTPAALYQPSARMFPTRMAEVDYPGTRLVRSVRPHGHFRWKKEDVFLSEVFWGERVRLLPADDRWFTVYFAQLPLARFDSHKLMVTPLLKIASFANPRLLRYRLCDPEGIAIERMAAPLSFP
jgi:putative transposase